MNGRRLRLRCAVGVVVACLAATALADRDAYRQRATDRLLDLFRSVDADRDGVVTREEAQGGIELEARFDDIDASRDGRLTYEELMRYLTETYGAAGTATSA